MITQKMTGQTKKETADVAHFGRKRVFFRALDSSSDELDEAESNAYI